MCRLLAAIAVALMGLLALLAGPEGAGAVAASDGSALPASRAGTAQKALQPPPQLQDALPSGSVLLDARTGDFAGNGGTEWVAIWTEPDDDDPPLPLHFGIVAPQVWVLAWSTTVATPDAGHASLETFGLAGPDVVALIVPGEARGSQLLIERWDRSGFSPLLQQSANDPDGERLEDLDGDGTPEVIRNESSRCFFGGLGVPYVTVVYRWDGTAFTNATQRFPQALDETDRILGLMLDDQIFWRNSTMNQKACYEAVVAYVAQVRGDQAAEDAACANALAYDPQWVTPADWQVTVC